MSEPAIALIVRRRLMPVDSPRPTPLVLVIDDSASLRSLFREALTLEGYRVLEAADDRCGVSLFGENRPDIVLLDIIMPEKDGIETLREIQPSTPTLGS